MLKEWLSTYTINNETESYNAKREIFQEIALAGLSRSGFFDHASFYGGTALRILYGLDRFSEDLDFSLNKQNSNFDFSDYLPAIIDEFAILDLDIEVSIKQKTNISAIESAFLKDKTDWSSLIIEEKNTTNNPTVKIKIEIDTNPPLPFDIESKLLLRPYSFYINSYKEPFLFAGKMHAILYRQWKNRVKGRDWYDMEWFIRRGTPLNLHHLNQRIRNNNTKDTIIIDNLNTLKNVLKKKIETLDINLVRDDVARFVKNQKSLNIWSNNYFVDLIEKITVA